MSGLSDGLEARYRVEKINDPTGKHNDCRYFVLDPQHDPIAQVALAAYAQEAQRRGFTALAEDLGRWRYDLNRRGLLAGTDRGGAYWAHHRAGGTPEGDR